MTSDRRKLSFSQKVATSFKRAFLHVALPLYVVTVIPVIVVAYQAYVPYWL